MRDKEIGGEVDRDHTGCLVFVRCDLMAPRLVVTDFV